jgi:ParB-like chromosome segregation protein Spo0J
LKIEQIDIDKIIPYINNPRKNLNSDKVASSIKEFGFQQPIVVDKDMSIIVGHTRYEAAKKLDLKTVPVVIADLPPLKAKAYRIADNRLNEDSEWDYNFLNIEFTDLLDNHYDLDNLGFNNQELENFITFEKDIEQDMPVLSGEDKSPFQQMTFTLHDSQAEIVKNALEYIKKQKIEDNINENKNANALTEICKLFYEKIR